MGEFASSLGISSGGGQSITVTNNEVPARPRDFFDRLGGQRSLGSTPIEKITRTGLPEDVLKRLAAKRPPVVEDQEAAFRFGKPARFEADTATGPSVKVEWPNDEKPKDPPEDALIREYDFVSRTVEVIRVENPSDHEQYVMEERDTSVLFLERDTGEYVRLNIRYP